MHHIHGLRGFSPVLHFCTDPRFGRCEESYGEDPMMVSIMGVAALTGLSGKGFPGTFNCMSTQVQTLLKNIRAEKFVYHLI